MSCFMSLFTVVKSLLLLEYGATCPYCSREDILNLGRRTFVSTEKASYKWKVCMESWGLGCIWVSGGLLWFYEGVKDFVGKDDVVVI
jgi:hypothetical protein